MKKNYELYFCLFFLEKNQFSQIEYILQLHCSLFLVCVRPSRCLDWFSAETEKSTARRAVTTRVRRKNNKYVAY